MTDPFSDIRPYTDDEVAAVLARLLDNREFLGAISRYQLGSWAAVAPWLVQRLVRFQLGREVRGIDNVHAIQVVIGRYMERLIERATSGFSVSGLEQLDPVRPYLYISNHRDIAMDPAFINYALHRGGYETARIAIGDNLLSKAWVADLMRLNKSFIVKRAISAPRELLAASRNLANYIRHSLQVERVGIWVAQREGRAKSGIDRTEPVIIKMLSMSRDKQREEFGEHIRGLGIVPVSISYELDPCDAMKARELYQLAAQGKYQKGEQEDVASIAQGITGEKGRVHVSFGEPLTGDFSTPDEVAVEIDHQVIAGYCLHPTNIYAYRRLYGEDAVIPENFLLEEGDCSEADFDARIAAMPQEHRPYALAIYANAVVSKLARAKGLLPVAQ